MPAITDPAELRRRVESARVARLATVRPDGGPRIVPVTFACVDDSLCSLVDSVKPKSGARLARLDDIDHDDRVALLVDRYDDDWALLWWVRVDGQAAVYEDGPLHSRALRALAEKYAPYRAGELTGAMVVVTPVRWTGWVAR